MMEALDVSDLFVSYQKTPVLWDVSFTIKSGTMTAIVGPNGAGKSTLVKSLVGLVPLLSGSILFNGASFEKVRRKVAYVPQKESVDWTFPITVQELVLMGRYGKIGLFKRPRKEDYEAVKHALNLVEMTEYAARQIDALSGGQKQRLFLARALVQEPDFYIMDEPFQGIDMASSHLILNLLQRLRAEGKTLLVVHHDLSQVKQHFDEVLLINLRLIRQGPVAEVLTSEYLSMAYGRNYYILDEAMKISERKGLGYPV